jgi:hypothetical protein
MRVSARIRWGPDVVMTARPTAEKRAPLEFEILELEDGKLVVEDDGPVRIWPGGTSAGTAVTDALGNGSVIGVTLV